MHQLFLRLFLFGGGFTRLRASSSATSVEEFPGERLSTLSTREVLCIEAVSFREELGKTIFCLQWATPVYLFYLGRLGYKTSSASLLKGWVKTLYGTLQWYLAVIKKTSFSPDICFEKAVVPVFLFCFVLFCSSLNACIHETFNDKNGCFFSVFH